MSSTLLYNEFSPTVRTLPNGLTVAMERLPHVHTATIGIWIKTGSANEAKDIAGVSHFLEHLFFKGTETRSPRDLMDAIESKGGQLNAFTSREYTCLFAKTLSRRIDDAIEILSDILKHPVFADLEKERNVILEEIASIYDVPEEYAHDLLTECVWPDHPLGRPITGYEETVSAIQLDDIRNYKLLWYRPEMITVSVAGNFDEDAVFDRVAENLSDLPSRGEPSWAPAPTYTAGADVFPRPFSQDHLAFAFPGVALDDPRRYAYEMLSSALGGGSTSRLFDRIREDEGLVYAIYSFNSTFAQSGMMGVYGAMAPENFNRTFDLCFEELRRLREEPLPPEELESNAEQLKGGLLMALESTQSRMARMARSLMFFGRVVPVDEILDGIDGVTSAEIQQLAREIFVPEQCTLTVLGPEPERDVAVPL